MATPPRNLRHHLVERAHQSKPFTARQSPRNRRPPAHPLRSDPAAHAQRLLAEIERVRTENAHRAEERRAVALEDAEGLAIDVLFVPNPDFKLASLEDARGRVELLTVVDTDPGLARATVYVPDGSLGVLERKIAAFTPTVEGGQRNVPLVSSLESIRRAVAESFWTDPCFAFPISNEPEWWEVWIRGSVSPDRFKKEAGAVGLEIRGRPLVFPDRLVFLARGTKETIARSADLLDVIAELRRATTLDLELLRLDGGFERELVGDAAERLQVPGPNAPAVCVLDTGVDRSHPLIAPLLDERDTHTCFGDDDADRFDGGDWHGTGTAGLSAFGLSLAELLLSRERFRQEHVLESVKIIPSVGQNDPKLYGDITQEAVARAEIERPDRPRVCVLPITARESRAAEPTSWSAAIDQLAAGAMDADRPRRLMVVSTGNVTPRSGYAYPDHNQVSPVEDPSHAWNVLTVGACTTRTTVQGSDYVGWSAIAGEGDLSPTSRTSLTWLDSPARSAPYKPDMVFEGGNWAHSEADSMPTAVDSLLVPTTRRRDLTNRLLGHFGGTSASSAMVARMGAILLAEYPKLWPETIRALLIHSCRWTTAMEAAFADSHGRDKRKRLLRCYGYGVPSLERARFSAKNATTLVIEREIQPFRIDGSKGTTNELHLHHLPWPTGILEQLGNTEVRVRITLSYFVDPNPGKRSVSGDAAVQLIGGARYPCAGLRFEMKTKNESLEQLQKRVNGAELAPGEQATTRGDKDEWTLGDLRVRGSIHSDVWTGPAIDLAGKDALVVYPTNGWWRFRHRDRGICERSMRYSLVVSVETDEVSVDLHTAIHTVLAVPTVIATTT
jgi:hypothetical protein